MLKIAQYILGAGLMVGATAASAGDLQPDAADGIMNSCRADYRRICAYVPPGEGRVARCLLDHRTELAPNCQLALRIASAVEECMPDFQRLCPGVPTGPQAFQCLADRMNMLAPACRRVVSANLPYMQPPGDRYSYNGGYNNGYNGGEAPYRAPAPYSGPAPYGAPAPYSGPAPYGAPAPYSGPAPYAGPNAGPYAYREGPERQDGYPAPGAPRQQYDGGPYAGDRRGDPRGDPRYDGGYAYRSGPQQPQGEPYEGYAGQPGPGGEAGRYAEQGTPRFRPYGDGYGNGYAGPDYGGRPPY